MENIIERNNDDLFLLNDIIINNYEKIIADQAEKIKQLDQKVDLLTSITHLSTVLPDALRISVNQNNKIETAFSPMVERAMNRSVMKNREKMVHIIFPLMGPAIRKAVAEAFRSWIQSVQVVVEQAFSWQGLKWRYESYSTGVPLAQVILNHCLVYRVEHVFLIHKKSAAILQQVHASGAIEMDKLTFSGMLEAVKDFAEDVFSVDEKTHLQSIELGNLKILLTDGPHAIVAAVARGTVANSVHQKICEVAVDIFSRFSSELAKENPDPTTFMTCDEDLERCLLEQRKDIVVDKPKHRSAILFVAASVGALLLALLAHTIWKNYSLNSRFNKFWTSVNAQKDFLITNAYRDGDSYKLDVLAEDSKATLTELQHWAEQANLNSGELQLRILKTPLLENSDFVHNEILLDSAIADLQKTNLGVFNPSSIREFISTITPTLQKIHRLSALNKQKTIVFFSHPPPYKKAVDDIMWVTFNRISKDRFTDYHFLRSKHNYEVSAPVIKLEVMKESL